MITHGNSVCLWVCLYVCLSMQLLLNRLRYEEMFVVLVVCIFLTVLDALLLCGCGLFRVTAWSIR